MPTFDIIVPCYNYGRFLRDCVESILRQEVSLRVLIIDDFSSDDTPEVGAALAQEDARVSFRRHVANQGHISTYNEGLKWARGELFVILSADDMLMPGALARASEALAAHPEATMAYGGAIYFEDGTPPAAFSSGSVFVRPWPHNADDALAGEGPGAAPVSLAGMRRRQPTVYGTTEFFRLNRFVNRPHMCSVVARTKVQKGVGGYRAELPHAGDFEMWLRLAAHGPVVRVHDFQVAARLHGRNMSSQVYTRLSRDFIQRALALDVVEASCGRQLPPGLMQEMRRGLAASAARAASGPFEQGNRAECDSMLALSRKLHPGIDRTLLWALLALKRRLGPGPWPSLSSRLRPVAERLLRLT